MLKYGFLIVFFALFFLILPKGVSAAVVDSSCRGIQPATMGIDQSATYTVVSTGVGFGENFTFEFVQTTPTTRTLLSEPVLINPGDTFTRQLEADVAGRYQARLRTSSGGDLCSKTIDVTDFSNPDTPPTFRTINPDPPKINDQITLTFETPTNSDLSKYIIAVDNQTIGIPLTRTSETEATVTLGPFAKGTYRARLMINALPNNTQVGDAIPFTVIDPSTSTACCSTGFKYDVATKQCVNESDSSQTQATNCATGTYCQPGPNICYNQDGSPDEQTAKKRRLIAGTCDPAAGDGSCTSAAGIPCGDDGKGVRTALGCVPTEPNKLITLLVQMGATIGGGITLLLMIFGAIRMIMSAGNPEQLKQGQEQFKSAVIGLLFIIFAVLLLQIIGVNILSIPGFS